MLGATNVAKEQLCGPLICVGPARAIGNLISNEIELLTRGAEVASLGEQVTVKPALIVIERIVADELLELRPPFAGTADLHHEAAEQNVDPWIIRIQAQPFARVALARRDTDRRIGGLGHRPPND